MMNPLIVLQTTGIYGLKPKFQNLLRPLARAIAAAGLRANQITVMACVLSAAVGLVLAGHVDAPRLFLILPVFLLLRMALNAIDGMLAREFDQKSNLGAYLNELGDVVSDAFCYLPFAYFPGFDPLWIGAVIVLAVLCELSGMIGPMVGASRRYDGPMGKSDRAFVFGILALWIGAGGPMGPWAASLLPKLLVVLLAVTAINRIRGGLAEAEPRRSQACAAPAAATRTEFERFFETHDGARLFYRYWPAVSGGDQNAIVLLHRGHEHSGRMTHVVEELDLPNFAVFAWDARGHGRSVLPPGSSPSLGTFVKDLDCFIRHISTNHGIPAENVAVVGQSVGSVLAATWAHDYAPKIRCMVLSAPAFKVKLYVPFARIALRLMYRLRGEFHVKSYVKPRALTHDPERIASYKADPLITRPISVSVLLGLYSTSDRVVADAQAIQVPTQLLISDSDWVVHRKPQLEFFDRLGSPVKEKHVFHGFYHDILGEKDRHLAMESVREFILCTFARSRRRAPLLDAHKGGYTKTEFDGLSRPLPLLSPKRLHFALAKAGMKLGGRFSDGIRLGLRTGFDSGSTLDYVYRNQPSGTAFSGKLIDRIYLNAPGWRGIRVRKENVVRALRRSMAELRAVGLPVRILDIAAGHGRYVLEALEPDPGQADHVLLRDFSATNVWLGWLLIQQKRLEGIVRFEAGDAFDRKSLAAIQLRPTLGVVSGLYELFPDNEPVRESLAGLADAILPGGFLVYTGQPFHPQLEMIARTLSSHIESKPWVMRRRTQAEMDQLVENAGFRKLEQWIDDEGIFSVSIAQRVGA
jgi:alpha-beta hydrolase superfamily lysophospholipase/phosphatidylglycerophosphate synthase